MAEVSRAMAACRRAKAACSLPRCLHHSLRNHPGSPLPRASCAARPSRARAPGFRCALCSPALPAAKGPQRRAFSRLSPHQGCCRQLSCPAAEHQALISSARRTLAARTITSFPARHNSQKCTASC